MDEWEALTKAVEAARWSPCAKSKRGVVIWRPTSGILSSGWNAPPPGQVCDGSERCRKDCGKRCVHAEIAAILNAGKVAMGSEMLHVKVVDGKPVPSGPPSCWQCSRHLGLAGIQGMWLLHKGSEGSDPVLRRYTIKEFHELTLQHCGIHPYQIEVSSGPPTPSAS